MADDPTEAEAREAYEAELAASRGMHGHSRPRWFHAGFYAGSATEREKVRALVTMLAEEMLNTVDGELECFYCAGIAHYFSPFDLYIDHTADCPWVVARLWLARNEVPDA